MKRLRTADPVEQLVREPALSAYQQALRDRLLAAPVMPAPEPWRSVFDYEYGAPVGGLLGIGFASDPESGHDLVMVVSRYGHGLFDAVTGEKIARDRDPDPEDCRRRVNRGSAKISVKPIMLPCAGDVLSQRAGSLPSVRNC